MTQSEKEYFRQQKQASRNMEIILEYERQLAIQEGRPSDTESLTKRMGGWRYSLENGRVVKVEKA